MTEPPAVIRDALKVAAPIADALASGRPVVALESTVIAHGLPYPLNIETMAEMVRAIETAGAVAAPIAIVDGRILVGLDDAMVDRVARADGVAKASAGDVAVHVARGTSGATTVAGTMLCAHLAGIRVFSTGGIGGVHREASTTFDISADITELARTPVAVVCSGAKSILDVAATLEMLETHSVPVLGLGVDAFPAFHVRDSGLPVPVPVAGAIEAARIVAHVLSLGRTGVVVANPVPEAESMDRSLVERMVEDACRRARDDGIVGKAITPYLLDALARASDGATLRANRALLVDNAGAAARIASALTDAASER